MLGPSFPVFKQPNRLISVVLLNFFGKICSIGIFHTKTIPQEDLKGRRVNISQIAFQNDNIFFRDVIFSFPLHAVLYLTSNDGKLQFSLN
jgi:hypothetical protein